MATNLENLQTAKAQIISRIVELTASLNPDHSEAGRSVSLASYLDTLNRQLDMVNKQIQIAEGPGESRSQAVCL